MPLSTNCRKSHNEHSMKALSDKTAPCLLLGLLFHSTSLFTATAAQTNSSPAPLKHYIIMCQKDVNLDGLIAEHKLSPKSPKHVWHRLHGFAAPMDEHAVQRLKSDERVRSVEPDGPVTLCGQTNGAGLVRIGGDH